MYEECFQSYGFTTPPFSKIIPRKFFYKSNKYSELTARLEYTIFEREMSVVTGENGVGKSTCCWYFIEQLKTKHRLGYIANPRLAVNDFYREILSALGVTEPKWIKKDILDQLKNILTYCHDETNEQPILLIDDAHLLSKSVLEEIRLISNLHFNTKKTLTIILVGSAELRKIFSLQANDSIRNKLGTVYHIFPYDKSETINYLKFRCGAAGNKKLPFDKEALNKVYQISKGITKSINKIANLAMIHCYNKGEKVISAETISEIADDIW